MDQGTSVQLARRARLGVLPEFWQALDYIWPDTSAGFSARPREGSYSRFVCACIAGNVLSGTALVWPVGGPGFTPSNTYPPAIV